MLRVMVMVKAFFFASFFLLLTIASFFFAFNDSLWLGKGLGVRVRVGLGLKSRDNTKIRLGKRQD